jgi:hypothetical protein
MRPTVPKCFATKNNDDQKLFGRNNVLLSLSAAAVLADPALLRPEIKGIITPSAEVMRTIKIAPMCRPWLYVPREVTPHEVSMPEQSPCVWPTRGGVS